MKEKIDIFNYVWINLCWTANIINKVNWQPTACKVHNNIRLMEHWDCRWHKTRRSLIYLIKISNWCHLKILLAQCGTVEDASTLQPRNFCTEKQTLVPKRVWTRVWSQHCLQQRKIWKQCSSPIREWINKLEVLYAGYYRQMLVNELVFYVSAWVNLERERPSKWQKDTYGVTLFYTTEELAPHLHH